MRFQLRCGQLKNITLFALMILALINVIIAADSNGIKSPIPGDCQQLLLVITASAESNQGRLYRYTRGEENFDWKMIGGGIRVSLGRNGLGWGRGLHHEEEVGIPLKKEGDGRSPAGVFELMAVFGKEPPEKMLGLKMPYIYLTEGVECVDDVRSRYYNHVISKDSVGETDWNSSEKMWHPGIWYGLGVVVGHNPDPVITGFGSCIFLHNWAEPGETTSGCTAMEPDDLRKIVFWLNEEKRPVLVQLPEILYWRLKNRWGLPAFQ